MAGERNVNRHAVFGLYRPTGSRDDGWRPAVFSALRVRSTRRTVERSVTRRRGYASSLTC